MKADFENTTNLKPQKNRILVICGAMFLAVALLLATAIQAFAAPVTYRAFLNPGHGLTMYSGQTGIDTQEASAYSDLGLYLDNCFVKSFAENAVLPEPDDRPGYNFVGWSYATDGERVTITRMPKINNMILYANWASTKKLTADDWLDDGSSSVAQETMYIMFEGSSTEFDSRYAGTENFGAFGLEYAFKGVTLTAGDVFQFAAPGVNMVKTNNEQLINDTVFPSAKGSKFGFQFAADSSKGYYTRQFIDVVSTAGASVQQNGNEYNLTYGNYAQVPKLKVLQTGRYNLYILVSDGGGWVKPYVEPA